MDIHHLKIFISVHRHQSFSRAAEELHISQPTISEHIKNLENELDCSLFDRLGRSISATPKAAILLPHALQVVEKITSLKETILSEDKEIRGEIIISASTIPGTYLLPKMAAAFKLKYPKTRFQLLINDTEQSIKKVADHEIYIAVTGGIIKNPALQETILFKDHLVCAVHKDLAEENIRNIPILIREKGSGTRQAMEDILNRENIAITSRNKAATLGSTAATKEALLAGLGFSIISYMAVKEELKTGILQQIILPKAAMTRPIVLIRHKKRTLPRRYKFFTDMLIDRIR
jgi:DNA-binding transcriptional LysR family regulator